MIGRLSGRVVAQEPDGSLILDVNGVGYELSAPLGTLGRAGADDAGRITLWIHTHVREDTLALFAFPNELERSAFRTLLGISNVGPKIAIAVLGSLPAAALSHAVARRDLSALRAIPGVGKKIAERLLLELRDKLPVLAASPGVDVGAAPYTDGKPVKGPDSVDERLRLTLTGMGFRPSEADRAVAALKERGPLGGPFEERLREALALLAR
jgi:holliday junction DNA helicase RuvA